jgi:hypothetical protein
VRINRRGGEKDEDCLNEDEDTFQDFVVVVTVTVVPFSNHHRVRSFPAATHVGFSVLLLFCVENDAVSSKTEKDGKERKDECALMIL